MKFVKIFAALGLLLLTLNSSAQNVPKEFVYIHDVIPDIVYDIRYAGGNNFVGEPIRGYENPVALLAKEAATALKVASEDLNAQGYCLKIFDAYRPQQAVDHFIAWARDPGDTTMKKQYYPEVDKKDLFRLGYIASRSGHSRGSTIDLSLLDAGTEEEVDMGSPYDFFGPISHHGAKNITPEQQKNREILLRAMQKAGFRAYSEEWWHYTLRNEPYPETYFNFPVK